MPSTFDLFVSRRNEKLPDHHARTHATRVSTRVRSLNEWQDLSFFRDSRPRLSPEQRGLEEESKRGGLLITKRSFIETLLTAKSWFYFSRTPDYLSTRTTRNPLHFCEHHHHARRRTRSATIASEFPSAPDMTCASCRQLGHGNTVICMCII
jgi:hypothetical protein